MNFPAKYRGRCALCGESFPAGARITRSKDPSKGSYAHTDCGEGHTSRKLTEAADKLLRDSGHGDLAGPLKPVTRNYGKNHGGTGKPA